MLGFHRHTVGHWLARSAVEGLHALWALYVPAGKRPSLPPEVLASLEQAFHRPEGYASDEERRRWGRRGHGVEVNYKPLYTMAHLRYHTKLKVARPRHTKTP
jgi:hypothetical protein